ncbi:hydroxymethylglutaryl-CoA synthase [Brachybacterium endophyticum]|uniref:Hydroxymethylglutaryl-CoA synthase n=1 Tax=Brachybacterium endophyticum TaxID=2182385 RepID=A0A2U2RHN6_9MICO|nr:hydroxymethylglutaryl-CoA synthase [Brachybacterium endophyticum]PWH05285.1 hydroxymethylglutaryl-CoA synthase [Brachybacterium endophyticum]
MTSTDTTTDTTGATRGGGIGIEDLELAASHHVLDLAQLAEVRGVDPAKYTRGIGLDEMGVVAADEDVVTLGASAAERLLARSGSEGVRTLLFATESGVDHSKSAAVIVHGLLGLPSSVRSVELKQACYAGAAAVQAAIGIVARRPEEKVLVITADVARYGLGSSGEPTQGAGAVAMLIGADPSLVEIEPVSGLYSADVDDFWRPNDSTTAMVNARLSISAYKNALLGAWDDLQEQGGPSAEDIEAFVYHQPFTKMAVKAQQFLAQRSGAELDPEALVQGAVYDRRLGNTYTASLWAGLASLLDHRPGLDGARIGLFSYGSGSAGEMLTGIVRPGYMSSARAGSAVAALDGRVPVTVAEYEQLHENQFGSSEDVETPRVTTAPFRFAGVQGGARVYERNSED